MLNESVSICSSELISVPFYHIIFRYIITLTGIFSNLFLITGLILDPLKCFKNSSSVLIMNLGLTDVLTCSSAFLLLHWYPCTNRYFIFRVLNLPSYIASSSIFTMAFDRYMSCVHPFKYRIIISTKVTISAIVLQWLLCAGYLMFEMFVPNLELYSRCVVTICILLSAAMLYANAAYVLKINSRYLQGAAELSSRSQNRTQSARLVNEKRLLTTMLFVSLITIATLTPVSIYESYTGINYFLNEHSEMSEQDPYHFWVRTLFLINFSVNPIMYAWRLINYRQTFRRLIFGGQDFGRRNRQS